MAINTDSEMEKIAEMLEALRKDELSASMLINSICRTIGRGLEFPGINAARNPSPQMRWREYWMAMAFMMQARESLQFAYCALIHAGVNADTLSDIKVALAATSVAILEYPKILPDESILNSDPIPNEGDEGKSE